MDTKKLFCVRSDTSSLIFHDENGNYHFSSKMEAKKHRNVLRSQGVECHVSKGPDHAKN